MDNTQINITANGTKTLATAGKYCDRNIDVNVNVPVKPTQFTNILDLPTNIVKEGYRAVTNNYSETSDGVAIVIFLKKGTHDIRVRGKWQFWFNNVARSTGLENLRTNVYFSTIAPTSEAHNGALLFTHEHTSNGVTLTGSNNSFNMDKYGDCYLSVTVPQDGYLAFTLIDMSKVYPTYTYAAEPIITIDEPIGNGGIV